MKPIDNAATRDETVASGANRKTSTDEWDIDRILADSFPASDPPPWTLGVTTVEQQKESVLAARSDRNGLW